jgi:NitT/TauT family transport system substrate-binding protein
MRLRRAASRAEEESMKLDLVRARALARSIVVAVLAAAAAPAFAEDAFAVGFVPSDVTSLAPRFAEAAGTFAAYGIKPELVTIEGGSRGVQVLLSGKLQAMYVGFSVAVNANREGADLRLVSASCNVMPMEIYASQGIRSAADLKGKKIAVSTYASETDMAVSLALAQWKLTRKDVAVTPLGGASQRIAAQLSGQVAAAPYVSPATATAREKGLTKLLDLSQGGTPWLFNGVIVNRDFARANPDLVKRFLKANIEGVYKALSDEKWAKDVIAKEFKTNSPAIVDDAYALIKRTYPRDFTPSTDAAKNVIAEVDAVGPPLATKNLADYVDLGPIEALKKEGFFEQLKKKYGV